MAMINSDRTGFTSSINVTPMIDVLLVLLIIFMVIVPMAPRGLEAMIPQPPKPKQPAMPERTIVVEAFYHPGAALTYRINGADVAKSDLLPRLTGIYANRAERVMFVRADDKVNFASVAELIAIGKSANVDHIGLMTPGAEVKD